MATAAFFISHLTFGTFLRAGYTVANAITKVKIIVVGAIILGIIFFIANKAGKNGKTRKEETEYLMFGHKYLRSFAKDYLAKHHEIEEEHDF